MRCEEVRPLISAGLDEELDSRRAAQMRAHVAGCALCRAEREALEEIVRLLRAVPEVEPPVELRRRIGAALLEAEQASRRRWLGLGLLMRPQAAGWSWGAAFGAAVAVVALVTTRGPAPQVAPLPVPPSTHVVAPAPSGTPAERNTPRPGASTEAAPKPVAALPEVPKPAPASAESMMKPVAALPRASALQSSAHPAKPVVPPRAAPSAPERSDRATRRAPVSPQRPGSSVRNPQRTAPPLPASGSSSPGRSELPVDEPPMPSRTEPMSSSGVANAERPNSEEWPPTSGMTQMASGTTDPPPVVVGTDALTELRRRLIERPLRVPELGELKPTGGDRAGKDGWIRF